MLARMGPWARATLMSAFLMIAWSGFIFTRSNASTRQQTAPPIVTLNPYSLTFEGQVLSATSRAQRITITNTGNSPLYIDSASIDGDNASDFALSKDTCTGATVAQNRGCIVDVTFTPSDTGERNAAVKFMDNAADSPQSVNLTGTGINSNDVPPF